VFKECVSGDNVVLIHNVEHLVIANKQQTTINNSLTVIRQFDPGLAKLLLETNRYELPEVAEIIKDLSETLVQYLRQDKEKKKDTKQVLVQCTKQLLYVGEKFAAIPGLLELINRIKEIIQYLPV